MRRIFVDLEMHPILKIYEGPGVWRQETIEIGAVMLDENLEEIGSFKEYVKPVFSDKVYGRIRKLTGITAEMLADADSFEAVLMRFCEWCGSGDYIVYSWSDADIWQIMEECRMKGITCSEKLRYMLNHWKDFQPEFSQMLQMEHVIALDKAVELGGLDFAGRAHDGLTDARNTANLFRQTSDRGSKEFARLRKNLIEAKKSCTYTLGEVFNFGTLGLAQ